jgi:succinate dehydrogenase / fumarate reductase cytochrome b subunit
VGTSEFYLKRLHSLSGVFLLVFLCVHLFRNLYVTVSSRAFDRALSITQVLPHLSFAEILFLGIPFAFHAIYGLVIWYHSKGNLGKYGHFHNWMYFLQEISGAVLFVFLVLHVWGTRIAGVLAQTNVDFQWMTRYFANPLYLIATILGVSAASFHSANGLWGFLVSAGIFTGKRAQKVLVWICGLVFCLSLSGFIETILSFVR